MSKSETKKTGNKDLVRTQNHKDAVIIIGDKCVSNNLLKIDEHAKR